MACKHNIVHRAFALMAALLTVLTVSCYCAGEKVFAASSQKGVVTVNALNVRKSPGTQNAVINVIYKGDSVEIVRTENGWHRILLGRSKYGWVINKYVKVSGSKDSAESVSKNGNAKTGKIIVSASTVNVRNSPSTSGKKICSIRKNEVYSYSEIKDGWYKLVTPSGESGYVSGKYVKNFKSYAVDGGGSYIWPTQTATRLTTRFGVGNHKGIDIAAPGGSQIIAVADGTVCNVTYNPDGFGHLIVIKQNDGIKAYYGHMMKETFLKKGDKVKAGDTIGVVGSTGKSTGNHLHLEFRKGDERIDPLTYYPNIG